MLDPLLGSTKRPERPWVDFGHQRWTVVVCVVVVPVGGLETAVEARLRLYWVEYPFESQKMVSRCLERSWDHF